MQKTLSAIGSLIAGQQWDNAFTAADAALKQYPEEAALLHMMGQILMGKQAHGDAADFFEKAVAQAPREALVWNSLGQAQFKSGNFALAAKSFDKAARYKKNWLDPLINKAMCQWEDKQQGKAIATLQAALKIAPGNLEVWLKIGAYEMARGRLEKALKVFKDANRSVPGDPSVQHHIGSALCHLNRFTEAKDVLEPIIQRYPDFKAAKEAYVSSLFGLGDFAGIISLLGGEEKLVDTDPRLARLLAQAYNRVGKREEAFALLNQMVGQYPDDLESKVLFADILTVIGKGQQVDELVTEVLEKDPDNAYALHLLYAKRNRIPSDEIIASIQAALSRNTTVPIDKIRLNFLLGDIFSTQGKYDEAFRRYLDGNRLRQQLHPYDREKIDERFGSTIRIASPSFFSEFNFNGADCRHPIFIVGMPRSGTSLVEQILASHPEVFGAGERMEIENFALEIKKEHPRVSSYLEVLSDLKAAQLDAYGARYFEILETQKDGATRITDKMPGNFMHLALIAKLFPKATIIHCNRHPLDTCLSCFTSNFVGEHDYTDSLEALAHYYRHYAELMAHWRKVLPLPIVEVYYETLVSNPEPEIRRLVEACNLPWNDACLSPHKTERAVATTSRWQVRQPINKGSVHRWERHREDLEPLRAGLADLVDTYPY